MFRATMPVKKTRRTGVWGAVGAEVRRSYRSIDVSIGRFWIDAPILSSVAMPART
jgi:hypothetical protein